jgi:3-oxoacyl-[acyl-carrier protein] reductase
MPSKLFDQRVAIITGAGVGIGLEIAHQLALQGASVLLNDLDETLARSEAVRIRASGGTCIGTGGDVGDVEVVRSLVTQAVENFGHLDIVVANAGITLWGDFFSYEPEAFNKVVAVNLQGSFFLAQAAARQMRLQKSGGRILLMSSVSGYQAIPYLSAYGMTKAGLDMLARSLVAELSPHGITINTLAPGATLTPRNLADDPHYESSWGGVTPTGRIAQPSDIARAALFLVDPASDHITGQSLIVDGGWTRTSPVPGIDFVPTDDSFDT